MDQNSNQQTQPSAFGRLVIRRDIVAGKDGTAAVFEQVTLSQILPDGTLLEAEANYYVLSEDGVVHSDPLGLAQCPACLDWVCKPSLNPCGGCGRNVCLKCVGVFDADTGPVALCTTCVQAMETPALVQLLTSIWHGLGGGD